MNGRDADALAQVQKIAGGPIYGAVALVNSADTASLALASVRKGGRVVLVGLYGGEIPVSLVTIVQRYVASTRLPLKAAS